MATIGQQIQQARQRKHWSQKQLAEELMVSSQYISRIESSSAPTPLELLMAAYDKLERHEGGVPLGHWLLSWIRDKSSASASRLTEDQILEIQKAIDEAEGRLPQNQTSASPKSQTSLEGFPWGQEVTVVTGDRRESRPLGPGDTFAYSMSCTDLMWILQAELPKSTIIRSDKLFFIRDKAMLRKEFGNRHLLIIGSPAVNHAARLINNHSLFRFDLAEELRVWQAQLQALEILRSRPELEIFWKIVQSPALIDMIEKAPRISDDQMRRLKDMPPFNENESLAEQLTDLLRPFAKSRVEDGELKKLAELARKVLTASPAKGMQTPQAIMNSFRKHGLIDLVDGVIHGSTTRENNDFGLISLAKNPFGDNDEESPGTPKYCVMLAGIHGPGTAHALKAFADGKFEDHPLGGIIEISMDPYLSWSDKFENAEWRWETKPYSTKDLERKLSTATEHPEAERNEALARLKKEEIDECLSLVRRMMRGIDNSGTRL